MESPAMDQQVMRFCCFVYEIGGDVDSFFFLQFSEIDNDDSRVIIDD